MPYIKQSVLHDIKKRLEEVRQFATLETANFERHIPWNPEKTVTENVREITKIHREGYVIGWIDRALKELEKCE